MRPLTILALLAFPTSVWAHALSADAKLRGGRVEIEAYFADNTPARNAQISVFNAGNEKIGEGPTDDKGRWSFAKPPAGRYRIEVNAGDGHFVLVQLTIPVAGEGKQVSDGPGREEFTSFPFGGMATGIGVIALGAIAWLWLRRQRAMSSCD